MINPSSLKMLFDEVYYNRKSCYSASVIRQKGESRVSRGKKYSFFGKFGVLCFLETPILRFALLPYYRRVNNYVEQSGEKSTSFRRKFFSACSKLSTLAKICLIKCYSHKPFEYSHSF